MQKLGVVEQAKRQPQLGQDVRKHHVQPFAVGQFDDGHVEFHVGRAHALPVGGVAAFQRHLHRITHVFFGRVARVGLRQRLAFDQAAHAVNVNDGGDAGDGHRHAAVGRMAHQPFFGEDAKDLAQGVARDLQALAQGRLRQALAGRELAFDDLLANQVGRAFIQGLGAGRRFGGHGGGGVWAEGECALYQISGPIFPSVRVCTSATGAVLLHIIGALHDNLVHVVVSVQCHCSTI